jgi:hypothetical protein
LNKIFASDWLFIYFARMRYRSLHLFKLRVISFSLLEKSQGHAHAHIPAFYLSKNYVEKEKFREQGNTVYLQNADLSFLLNFTLFPSPFASVRVRVLPEPACILSPPHTVFFLLQTLASSHYGTSRDVAGSVPGEVIGFSN